MNVRGLHSGDLKRRKLFNWIYQRKVDIIFFQESHSTESDENKWRTEFDGEIIFNHGSSDSRGVCILIRKYMSYEIHDIKRDNHGRYIIADITINNKRMTLGNLYGPNKDDALFFNEFIHHTETYTNDNRVIGGDFNCILNPVLDKKGGRPGHPHIRSRNVILDYMDETELVDIWRLQHHDHLNYTYHTHDINPVFTRLDYFLVSHGLVDTCEYTDIIPGYQSDHSFITMKIIFPDNGRGRGFLYIASRCRIHRNHK